MAKSERDEYGEEAWRDALRRTWFALEDEGRDPAKTMGDWSERKPSTIRAWKRGDCTPGMAAENRLARNALAEGFPQLASLSIPGTHRIERRTDEVTITGKMEDNVLDLIRLCPKLLDAYRDGNAERIHKLADRIEREADEVRGEAKRTVAMNGTA